MRTCLFLGLLCSLWLTSHAQPPCVQTHKGEVLLRSAQGKNAKGIVVSIDGNTGTPTDQNGVFQFRLTKCPGMSVRLKVNNDTYGLVNHVEMSSYTLRKLADPNDFQFSLIVSPGNQLETDRIAYYSLIAGLALDKGQALLKGKIQELEQVLNRQLQKNERLIDSLATLRTQYAQTMQSNEKRRQEIEEIAKIFAQRTEIDSSYQQAFKLYKDGKPTQALRYLSDEKMQDEKQRFLKKRAVAKRLDEEAQKEQEFYVSKCLFKAVIYRNLVDMQKAEQWYREAVVTDTTKFDNLFALANFLQDQNRPVEPEHLYKKALSLNSAEPDSASALINLGIYYQDNNLPIEAEGAYLQAQHIYERLAQENPDQYEPHIALILNNLGTFHQDNNHFKEAEKAYLSARQIYKHLAQVKPGQYESDSARPLNNLGNLYQKNNRPQEAESAYLQARQIYKRLAQYNPDQYEPSLALTLNNLGNFYQDNNRPQDAKNPYQQALQIRKRLVQKNPDQYEPDLASTLNNLGKLYETNDRPQEAGSAYLQARQIYERLTERNPDQYEPALALTLNNLGLFHQDNNRPQKAKEAYLQVREIRERLARKNPDQYEPALAKTLNILGVFYKDNDNPQEAKVVFLESKKLYEKWNDRGEEFEKELSNLLFQLAFMPSISALEEKDYLKERDKILQKHPDWLKEDLVAAHLKKEIELAADYNQKCQLTTQLISHWEQQAADPSSIALGYGNLALYRLFTKAFDQAEKAAEKGLLLDNSQEWIYTNLVLSYLFQGKLDKAKKIYTRLKDKPHDKATYKTVFLQDLADLEAAGITHPDVAIIRNLLK